MKEGIRWSIGDGSKIHVWYDPRLRNDEYIKLQGLVQLHQINLKVRDLMLPGMKKWSKQTIVDMMHPTDAAAILCVPPF